MKHCLKWRMYKYSWVPEKMKGREKLQDRQKKMLHNNTMWPKYYNIVI